MKTGLYIRRAVGYFIKLVILVGVLYLLMYATGTARVSADQMFGELFNSNNGFMLIGALVLLSAFYPKFGYISRTVKADLTADREMILNAFHADNYIVASEKQGESITFRSGSIFRRLWMTFDDKVTVKTTEEGIIIEGMRKEVVYAQFRINTFNNSNNEN